MDNDKIYGLKISASRLGRVDSIQYEINITLESARKEKEYLAHDLRFQKNAEVCKIISKETKKFYWFTYHGKVKKIYNEDINEVQQIIQKKYPFFSKKNKCIFMSITTTYLLESLEKFPDKEKTTYEFGNTNSYLSKYYIEKEESTIGNIYEYNTHKDEVVLIRIPIYKNRLSFWYDKYINRK